MPAVLRRLCSNSSNSSDGFETLSPHAELQTPLKRASSYSELETPIKRRRLTIVTSSQLKAKEEAHQDEFDDIFPVPEWTVEDFVRSTPSRHSGISEKAERKMRMIVADKARCLASAFLDQGSSAGPAQALQQQRGQALACYYVQLFFMSESVESEDRDIVAIAATFSALKALNIICFLDDVLVVFHGQHPTSRWSVDMSTKITEVEKRMAQLADSAQLSSLKCRPEMALDFVDKTVQMLIRRLPESEAFCKSCSGKSPEKAAGTLSTQITEAAHRYAVHAMLGPVAVLIRPVVVTRVVVVMAARRTLQQQGAEVSVDELMGFMTEVQGPPGACDAPAGLIDLRHATKEVIGTLQLWEQEK